MITIPIRLEFHFESNQKDVEPAKRDASHYVMEFLERCPAPRGFGLRFKAMTIEDPARIVSGDAGNCEKIGEGLVSAKVYASNRGPRTKKKDREHYFWHYCDTCGIYTPFVQGEHQGHKTTFIDGEETK